MKTEATLAEDQKEYILDGKRLARLTTVLQETGIVDYSDVPQRVRERGLDRGRKVHLALELYDQDALDEDDLDPQLVPYLDGWKLFLRENDVEWIEIEKIAVHPDRLFACRPDRIGRLNGVPAVLEVKSGALMPFTGIQLAGQAEAVRGRYPSLLRYGVELPGNGKYKLHAFTDRNDRTIFMSALAVFTWKMNHQQRRPK